MKVVLEGLSFGESARWHDGRLWFADWGTHEVVAVKAGGTPEVVATVPTGFQFSIDWSPDGRLLVIAGQEAVLLRQEPDGSFVTHADLSSVAGGFNEIVVDARGNTYVNGGDANPMAGDAPKPGIVALVTATGEIRQVADEIAFGNGMAVTADGRTLIVAESHGRRLSAFTIEDTGDLSGRRVWAEVDGHPDGICLDAEGAVWYADVPNQRCQRVREGGDVLQTIDFDDGAFSCMLGGDDGTTLYTLTRDWKGFAEAAGDSRTGRLVATPVSVPHAGHP